jgi:hypothetical protein
MSNRQCRMRQGFDGGGVIGIAVIRATATSVTAFQPCCHAADPSDRTEGLPGSGWPEGFVKRIGAGDLRASHLVNGIHRGAARRLPDFAPNLGRNASRSWRVQFRRGARRPHVIGPGTEAGSRTTPATARGWHLLRRSRRLRATIHDVAICLLLQPAREYLFLGNRDASVLVGESGGPRHAPGRHGRTAGAAAGGVAPGCGTHLSDR